MYNPIYRCRLCYKEYAQIDEKIDSEDVAVGIAGNITIESSRFFGVHFCSNGSIGVSEFQGFVKYVRNPPSGKQAETP